METGVSVWITNFAGHDYEPAKEYGELKHIIKGFISFQSLDRVKYQIVESLQDYKENDFLLLSGTNIINVIATAYVMNKFRKVFLLVFDKDDNTYRKAVLTASNFGDIDDAHARGN